MPFIDVTDALLDPDFAEFLTIQRRAFTIGDNGRQIITITYVKPAPVGVVVPKNMDIFRNPDYQTLPRLVTVYTQFMLRGPSPGGLPDYLLWGGDTFIVNGVEPWSHYGPGWVKAECSSIDSVDMSPSNAL